MTGFDPTEPEAAARYEVVLARPGARPAGVFSGDLEACQDWLVLNADRWADGTFEIRPAGA